MPAAAVKLAPISFTSPTVLDLTAYRGDSGRFRVTVTTSTGTPLDVSAATWDCDVRATADDPVALISLDVVPVAGDPSSVDIVLSSADSELLRPAAVWDLEMTLNGEVTTLLAGKLTTTLDVSRDA